MPKKTVLPFVSILTPTANRRLFIPQLLRCFRKQDYPLNRMELVVADDGDDLVGDLLDGQPRVRYLTLPKGSRLGYKRNFLTEQAKGDILVHMDDDDYYPPDRVSHAVRKLHSSEALIAGASLMYIYHVASRKITRSGPYNPYHGTNGTFAYKRAYLEDNRFDDEAITRDEALFTKNFTRPMVQLDTRSTILCISHAGNTYAKKMRNMTDEKLKNWVKCRESLRFYRYQLGRIEVN
jgi:glycosyltransferase involved in cell wall biosynthesis